MIKTLARLAIIFIILFFHTEINFSGTTQKMQDTHIDPPQTAYETAWVDSLMTNLTLDEKIGQLFMAPAYSNRDSYHVAEVRSLITDYHIGGIIFFQGGPVRQARMTNRFQADAKIPLMIAMDAEWGLGMRLDSTISYPQQMLMGAIQDNLLIYEFGEEVARQCRRLGVHINFAPVADINNNPRNPVINSRSFGELRENVTAKSFAYMKGMQDNGVMAVAKHFPGHGDTDQDSHYTLPLINHNRYRLDSLELYPFKNLIDNGLSGIMVAHLYIPELDNTANLPTTLSRKVINDLLRNELKFSGLTFTDAMGMQGVTRYHAPGIADVKALNAGNDVLLMSENIPIAIKAIKNALREGTLSMEELNQKVRRILSAKAWLGLTEKQKVEIENLSSDLNSPVAQYMERRLIEAGLTLIDDKSGMIPLKNLDKNDIAAIVIGNGTLQNVGSRLSDYDNLQLFAIHKNANESKFKSLESEVADYKRVIVFITSTSRYAANYGVTPRAVEFAEKLTKEHDVILAWMANPYGLTVLEKPDNFAAILVGYNDSELHQDYAAQLIYGGIAAKGKLPVGVGKFWPARTGIETDKQRLKYSIPIEVRINETDLLKIDTLVNEALKKKAIPGCQILTAKEGVVFFRKSYGYHTYSEQQPVVDTDIYDLASITKVAATLPALMKLHENKVYKLDDKISDYLPNLKGSNKNSINFRDMLTHQARLSAWIPYYLHTFDKSYGKKSYILRTDLYKNLPDSLFTIKVADNLYMIKTYPDSMHVELLESNMRLRREYRYSDLGFYLFKDFVEQQYNTTLDYLTDSLYYAKLGAATLTFNPLDKFPRSSIVPTEQDKIFRKQLVHGYVHDYGAAMQGGVGGHAGLFGNANDLAKMFQMYLQKGTYGGVEYFSPYTIDLFTSAPFRKYNNRRALGFDKPGLRKSDPASSCTSATFSSYGHTGFTGTIAWVEPQCELVYVFLSNRIYPDIENEKLLRMNTRTDIQQVFYDAILKGKKEFVPKKAEDVFQ